MNEACPICASEKSAEIIFGLPRDMELIRQDLDLKRKVLGGCDIPENAPKYHCNDCGHEWGDSEWNEIMERAKQARLEAEAAKEKEAIQRGVFDVTPNESGFVKCPFCNTSFSIRHAMSWDGKMHESCHTRLKIVGE